MPRFVSRLAKWWLWSLVLGVLACALLTRGAGAAPGDAGAPPAPSATDALPSVPPVALPEHVDPPEGRRALVVRIALTGPITNVTAEFVAQAIARAERERAQALVVVLDTPGGVLEATRAIVQSILDAPLPVVTFVAPAGARAASAGLFVTLASHVAAMHPTSNIGAAHPVSAFGGDIEGALEQKIVSDTAAWARSLAQARGRNSAWAEQAVLASKSLTAQEAKLERVIDRLAPDLPSLLDAADGLIVAVQGQPWRVSTRGAERMDLELTARQKLYAALSNPVLVYLLLIAGAFGLYVELTSPGLIVPGLVGALCLALVFGLQSLPMNRFALLLMAAAAVLLIAEIYVTSFGILSVAGLTCLVLGSYMLFDVPGSAVRLSPIVIWSTTLAVAALGVLVAFKLVGTLRQGATSGTEAFIGRSASVTEAVGPGRTGKVFFDGTLWNATSTSAISAGQPCRVVAIEGLCLRVEPEPPSSPPAEA